MKNFKQNINEQFEKLGKMFSCKSSCKVDDLLEDKENKKPTNNQKNYCNSHIKPLSFYCRSCRLFLCVLCCSEHSNIKHTNHEFIELQNMDTFIPQEIEKLVKESSNIREKLILDERFQNLPDYQKDFEEGMLLLDSLKKECFNILENHFQSLSEDYLNLFKSLPCKFQKDSLEMAINDYIQRLQSLEVREKEMRTNHSKQKIKNIYEFIPEVKKFNEMQFENELEILKKSLNVLINFQPAHSKKVILPKISVGPLKKLENSLIDTISLIGPTENPYDQFKKIRLSMENYFHPQYENYLGRADCFNEQLLLYNITSQTEEKVCLSTEFEIPQNHSLVITPNLDILLLGGQMKDGTVSKDLFYCSPMGSNPEYEGADLPLVKKSHMAVERMDPAISLVDGVLYCFGGKNNSMERISCCEKYLINEDRWENISSMNFPRASFGASAYNNSMIFVFFGCQNDLQPFEKYDIGRNVWDTIRPINLHSSLCAQKVGCIQINPNQILIVGGKQEIKTENNEKMEQENLDRGILYNVSENSLINLGSVISEPLIDPSQMIISNKNVYCLGKKEKFSLSVDFEWVFKLQNGKGFDNIGMLHYNKSS